MIKTSSYNNFKSDLFKTVSISGDRGKGAGYAGSCYPKLAPKLTFWKRWHENIGVIPEEENDRFYIEEYYKQVLSVLDPGKVYDDLNHSILLCYEGADEFCHRHIVAAWFELFLNETVPETIANGVQTMDVSRPAHIKQVLEKVIKENKDMRGFNSLCALYLFEKSEYLEDQATKLEEETGKSHDGYRQAACYLRCDADEAEAEYNAKQVKSKNRK